jgi:diguanylate cyclase (GGDEF)-like protein
MGTMLRVEDVFARYGGEEFVVLARGLNLRNGVKLGDRMREAIAAKPFVFAAHRFRVTVSAGVSELAECKPKPSGERLLELADGRLYKAKEAGRNRVVAK